MKCVRVLIHSRRYSVSDKVLADWCVSMPAGVLLQRQREGLVGFGG